MMNKRIVFLDSAHPHLISGLTEIGFNCDEDYVSSYSSIVSKIGNYSGLIIRSRFKIDRNFIDAANGLKFIARVGAGMENIDVEYAQSKGIVCLHAPEGNRTAVAEQCIAMLLCLFNNIAKANIEVRNNNWIREANRGVELEGKTVAIIGYGNMGSAFAQRLQGFGVHVLCYDKYKTNYTQHNFEIETSLQTIFDHADVVSLHIPYCIENHYYVDEKFINSFAKNIYIINSSRGKILNTAHLVNALNNNKVLGACLDVLEYESLNFEHLGIDEPQPFTLLKSMQNVILTPHIAGWTHESNLKMAEVLLKKIQVFF